MKLHGYVLQLDAVFYFLFIMTLGAIAFSFVNFDTDRGAKAYADTANIGAAISQYKFEIGSYPNNLKTLTEKNNSLGPWLTSVPDDPWGREYQYLHDDNQGRFAVFSFGEDGSNSGSTVTEIADGDIGFTGR